MKRENSKGFTLVELMITVAIVGVLAALASYGVGTYVKSARTAEARANVGRMAKDAAAAYARGDMAGTVLKAKASVVDLNRLCVTASKTVPQQAAKVKGKKYQSNPSEWVADAKTAGKGFSCLRFSVTSPQYFIYRYKTSTTNVANSGNVNVTFDAIAQGDLDGDGKLSEIKLSGKVVKVGKAGKELFVAPTFVETNPTE